MAGCFDDELRKRFVSEFGWILRDANGDEVGYTVLGDPPKLSTCKGIDVFDFETGEVLHKLVPPLSGLNSSSSPIVGSNVFMAKEFFPLVPEAAEGVVVVAQLKEGVDSASAARWLYSTVREENSDFSLALLPLPWRAKEAVDQLAIPRERRCACLVFPTSAADRVFIFQDFYFPAAVLTLFLTKGILVTNQELAFGVEQVQAQSTFLLAGLVPPAASLLGQIVCFAGYRMPGPRHWWLIGMPWWGFLTYLWHPTVVPRSRAALVDLALASSLASLGASVALLNASTCRPSMSAPALPSLEAFGLGASSASPLLGVVMVRADVLGHSGMLTDALDRLSCASLPAPGNSTDVVLAVSPVALAGMLGLHFTAVSLLPLGFSTGRYLLDGIIEDDRWLYMMATSAFLLLTASFFFSFSLWWLPVLGAGGLFPLLLATPARTFFSRTLAWDLLSSPGLVRQLVAWSLLLGAFLVLLPKPLVEPILQDGFNPLVGAWLGKFTIR